MSKLTYQDIKNHPHPICLYLASRRTLPASNQRSQDVARSEQERQALVSKLASFSKIYKVKSHRNFNICRALDKRSPWITPENILFFMKKYLSTAGTDTKRLGFTITPNQKNLISILDIVQRAYQLQELDLNFQSSSSSDETSCKQQQQQQIFLFARQLRKSFPRLRHLSLSFSTQYDNNSYISQQFCNIIAKRVSSLPSFHFNPKINSSWSPSCSSVKLAQLGKELGKTSNHCKKLIFDFSFQGGSFFESLQEFLRNMNPSRCNIQSLKIILNHCMEIRFNSVLIMLEMIMESMPSLKKLEVDMSYCSWAIEENLSAKVNHTSNGSKLIYLKLNFWSNVNLNDSMIRELTRSTILIQGSSLKKISINLGKSSITSRTMMFLLFEVPDLMKYLKEIVYNFSQCHKIIGSEVENKGEQCKISKRLMSLKTQVLNCRGLQIKHLQALEEKLVQSFVNKGCLVNFNMKELVKKKGVLALEECKNKEANKK